MHYETLVFCLLILVIALHTFLLRTPIVEVEDVEIVVEVMSYVKYFILYAVYSAVKSTLTSLLVMARSTFKHSIIVVIKNYTPNNLILGFILVDSIKR